MASAARNCADEVAPTDTLRVLRMQRLRIRQAAAGCLDPIAEEDDSNVDDKIPAGSPSAYSSRSSRGVDLCRKTPLG
ncbi:unnamed protein product [Alopecurus aequalis]